MNRSERKDTPRKKVRHFDLEGDAHFLTFSCYRRLPLLHSDRTRLWFVEALVNARAKHGFNLWAWVIMPEHVHLLLWPRTGTKTQDVLADIKRPVGQRAIAWLEEHCPEFLPRLTVQNKNRTYRRFWQAGPGQDRNIHTAEAAHKVVEYIHQNPVTRGLVARAELWPWSSAAEFAGSGNVLLHVDRTLPTLVVIPSEQRSY